MSEHKPVETGVDVDKSGSASHTAGIFDIRNIIGSLLAIYGVILLAMGLFGDQALDKTDGINANLWGGIALLAVGLGFMAWAKARPVRVPDDFQAGDADEDGRPAGHP